MTETQFKMDRIQLNGHLFGFRKYKQIDILVFILFTQNISVDNVIVNAAVRLPEPVLHIHEYGVGT